MTDYRQIAIQAAEAAGIDPNIFVAQIQQESGFNPNAQSPAGAEGIAQFMPATANGLAIDPWNPVQALQAAAKLDANNLHTYGGDWSKALAAYNAGGGSVNSWVRQFGSSWLSHAFPETQNYVNSILKNSGAGTSSLQVPTISPGQSSTPSPGQSGTILGYSASQIQQFGIVVFAGLVIVIGVIVVFHKKEAT